MDNLTVVIASHSSREAISHCMMKHASEYPYPLELVLVQDILNEFDVFDCVSDEALRIEWTKPNGEIISNKNAILFNRILCVSSDLFLNFVASDRFYAQREFEAYLGFSLNAFHGISNKQARGLCESILSLPQQWHKVSDILELTVPRYYWGMRQFNTMIGVKNLVYSEVYNVLNWRACADEGHFDDPVFCFEKPRGEPLFLCVIHGAMLITTHAASLSQLLLEKIKVIIHQINQRMEYFAYELLLFIQDTHIVFGCINLEIIHALQHPDFETFVITTTKDALRSCYLSKP
jgi:hypothetical protein